MPRTAAIYTRSSKDRSAISIQAQRHELLQLAKSRDLVVVAEFDDAVESGKDEDRPAFQRLLRELKHRDRGWSVVLIYDTSRIGRRRYIAETFRHECKKLGVEIYFAKVPEVDPISQVVLDSVFQAMDEVHSLMSREKGLAGMRENIRQGFRAGGRAPYGYRLELVETGQIRDGQPVTKSRLVPDPATAPMIAAWLRGRAAGANGTRLADQLGISLAKSTLTHLEWCALTYAGATVWNMHRGKEDPGEGRRRPRAAWVVQPETHTALITTAEAEAILARLEGKKAARQTRARISDYLLSGILVAPDGHGWHGNSGYYRHAAGSIKADMLEAHVLGEVAGHLASDQLVDAMASAARAAQRPTDGHELQVAERDGREIEARIRKLTGLLEHTSAPGPLLRRLEQLEGERQDAGDRLERLREETRAAKALAAVTAADVRRMLRAMADDMQALEREHLKDFLRMAIDEIQLDPTTRAGAICYRLGVPTVVKVASPRRPAVNHSIGVRVPFQAPKNRRAA